MKAQMKKVLAIILTGIMVSVTFQPIGAHAAEYTEQLESDAEWEGTEIEEAASEGLNYLYINKNYVDEQEAQDIMVSWGNDGSDAPHMSLRLENEEGQNTFVEGTRYENNTVLFSSVLPKGIYRVTGLEIEGETTTNVSMEEYGIYAGFGVGEEYSGEKSEYESMESAETVDDVEYAVADIKGIDMEEDAEQVAETLANVDSSAIAVMSLEDSGIATQSDDGELVIVLDPGHDSKHAGARGNGVSEEVATLRIAQYCKEELEKYSGVKVYLTRNDASCPFPDSTSNIDDIKKRVEWAKTKGADVFVSIHLNSGGASARGAEVYYPSQSSEGKTLAQKIQNELVDLGLYDRKIKYEDEYAVIKNSMANGFPGLIVEHAFVSNYSDAVNYLKTESGLQKLGIADANGIAKYYGLSEGDWKTDANGNKYYYQNGKKVTGEKNINGKWYYFNSNGIMVTGWHKFPEKTVYYKSTGEMVHGEYNINDEWYHFNEFDGSMTTGWYKFSNKTVYYKPSGGMVHGEYNINNEWYHFNEFDGSMTTGWYKFSNKTVYYKPSGEMVHGEYNINNEWHHFDEFDGSMTTGWYKFSNKTVYYKPSGEMVHGEYNINNEWHHFDEFDGSMTTGWYKFSNKTVYYKPSGGMVHGEYNIQNEWYHFSEYDGSMTTGWYKFSNKTVYYKSNGEMVHGEYNINDEWYHFSEFDGSMTTGWYKFSNKTVYYKPSGEMVHGEYNINNEWHHFSEYDGSMTTGWYRFPNKTVYYKPSGGMAYGRYQIGSDWYYFDTYDGSMKTDFWYNNDYFGSDGKLVKKDSDDEEPEELHEIMGNSSVSVQQMVKLYEKYATVDYPTEIYEKGGAASIEELANIFWEEANAEGVKAEVAWAQSMLETGYLKFGGQVKAEQFNFAGLGAVDGGAAGADFSVYGEEAARMGVRAQIQHLKAYASKDALNNECVDSRFELVRPRGCAQYVEHLGQKENPDGKGWATGKRYGYKILSIIEKMNNI